jgi:hypothetical protein
MGYVYICMKRTDIPNGVLQVLDLQPNVSQRNGSIDPPGQTKYVNRPQNDTLAALAANLTVAEYKGIAAYLIDHVEDNTNNVAITVGVANASANAIVALLDAGSALTLAAINTALVANGVDNAGAGTQLNANGSDGVLADLLKIVAGAEYVLPSGSLVGNVAGGPGLGSFTNGQYRNTYDTGAFQISFGEGMIAGFMGASFEYDGTSGAALVCYTNTGALYTL